MEEKEVKYIYFNGNEDELAKLIVKIINEKDKKKRQKKNDRV